MGRLAQFFIVSLFLSFASVETYCEEFRFRLNEDLGSLDWGHGEVNGAVVQQMMEGLTVAGRTGEPVPAVAKSWRFDKKKNEFQFLLNPTAKWSDGKQVCAQNFIDGWLRSLSAKLSSPFAHYFYDIKNAARFRKGEVPASFVGLRATGCHELQVTLEGPYSYFPARVSHWIFFPFRTDLLQKHGNRWTDVQNLVVNGPYFLKEWKKDSHYLLEANPAYWGKKPKISTLRAISIADDGTALRLYEAGKLDWLKDMPFLEKERLSKTEDYQTFSQYVGYHLGFRYGDKGLPRDVRCALAQALQKDQIPKILHGGEKPAWNFAPTELGMAAKAHGGLIKSSGSQKPDPNKQIVLHFYAKDIHEPLVEWIQDQWQRNLGFTVILKKMESKMYWSNLSSNPPEIFLSGTTASYAHPHAFLNEMKSSSAANWGKFRSRIYDDLVDEIATLNADEKNKKTQKVLSKKVDLAEQVLIDQECAVAPLYFRKTSVLVRKNIRGFFLNPLNYAYLKEIY